MKITKFGHCCLLIEENGVKILTDPGSWSSKQDELNNLDAVLITHDHEDHCHVESVKQIVANNPEAVIYTIESVGELLDKEKIAYKLVKRGDVIDVKGVKIEVYGEKHAVIHEEIPLSGNVGFFFSERFFYPGDAYTDPKKPVEILATPIAGPWCTVADGINYAIRLHPKISFPVHEGMLKIPGTVYRIPPKILEPKGIKYIPLELGKEYEF